MSYEQITVNKSASESYETVLSLLDKLGFKIERRRDLASIVQASKAVDGKNYVFNITCGMGLETKITMGCISEEGRKDDETYKPVIEAFLKEVEQALV